MNNITSAKFKGHESFALRRGWIYKGLTAIDENSCDTGIEAGNEADVKTEGNTSILSINTSSAHAPSEELLISDTLQQDIFASKDANIILGLGSNMCRSLRYYLRATGLTEEQKITGSRKCTVLTRFGRFVLARDPNLRFPETVALVHLKLTKNPGLATAWYLFFHKLEGMEISAEELVISAHSFLAEHNLNAVSDRSIEDDFGCITTSYAGASGASAATHAQDIDPENVLTCPFTVLKLLRYSQNTGIIQKLPINWQRLSLYFWAGVFLEDYCGCLEVPLENLYELEGSPGRAFNLSRADILRIADELDRAGLVHTIRTSGLDVIRLNDGQTINRAIVDELFSRCYTQKQPGELIKHEY